MYDSSYLAHYGIKGQKWGVRRFQNEDRTLTPEGKERYRKSSSEGRSSGLTGGINRRTGGVYDRDDGSKDMARLNRDAKKDAEDMARAKAYYGEGAGNRRKQIRNRISERMKDPDYKAAYEKHLANQNMAEHQKAANRERKAQDTKENVKKIARGVKNILLGFGSTSLAAIAIVSFIKNPAVRETISKYGNTALSSIKNMMKKGPTIEDYNWHPGNSSSATFDFLNRR